MKGLNKSCNTAIIKVLHSHASYIRGSKGLKIDSSFDFHPMYEYFTILRIRDSLGPVDFKRNIVYEKLKK